MGYVNPDRFEDRLRANVESIANPHNRERVTLFLEERRAQNFKVGTLLNEATALRDLCAVLGDTHVEAATKLDILKYANQRERVRVWRNRRRDGACTMSQKPTQLAESTRCTRNITVRQFYKWLLGDPDGDEVPAIVRFLKVRRPHNEKINADSLVDAATLRALLQAHPEPRERALLAVLQDTGLRAGEACALNIGSVRFESHEAVVDGVRRVTHSVVLILPQDAEGLKTGWRRIRVYECVEYLRAWFEVHPRKADPAAALFHTLSNRAPGDRLTPNALFVFVQRAAKKAGIRKHLHPHLFRHTAATERARRGWSEPRLRAFFGWSRTSTMPTRYVHLAELECEEIEMRERGIVRPDLGDGRALAPLECPACRAANAVTSTFCAVCRVPLAPDAEAALDREREAELEERVARMVRQALDARRGSGAAPAPLPVAPPGPPPGAAAVAVAARPEPPATPA